MNEYLASNRWDASDGRSGTIDPFTCVHGSASGRIDEQPGQVAQQKSDNAPSAAPTVSIKTEGSLSAAAAAAAAAAVAAAAQKGEGGKRVLPEKARRELAKHLRAVTSQSARQCEKALQLHGDDIQRAADWLLSQSDGGREATIEQAQ